MNVDRDYPRLGVLLRSRLSPPAPSLLTDLTRRTSHPVPSQSKASEPNQAHSASLFPGLFPCFDPIDTTSISLFTPLTISTAISNSNTISNTQNTQNTQNAQNAQVAVYDLAWVLGQLEGIGATEAAASVVALVTSKVSDSELQGDLFDLLGVGAVDVIAGLCQARQAIAVSVRETTAQGPVSKFGLRAGASTSTKPTTTTSSSSSSNKPNPSLPTGTSQSIDAVALRRLRDSSLAAPPPAPRAHDAHSDTPFFKTALPEGTTRKVFKGYEEVVIPAAKKVVTEEKDLVPISAFDEWARMAFPGIKHLNRLQSKLFKAAYRSNENLLVCAPTGAGKTNVALMTVLHEVGSNLRGGVLAKEDFKIVYVAPMKALVQEMVENFRKRLGPLGIVVKELTGDMNLTKAEINETQIIVTTPEKWDVISRKSGSMGLTQLVRLLIIDEVHLLHDDRGSVIETLVARTLRQVESTQSMIRIVGLSATLPNYEDVAMFLRVNPARGLFYFGQEFRPVPLQTEFLGVTEADQNKRRNFMNELAFEKAVAALKRGKQVMVFVHARNDTTKTARALRDLAVARGLADLFQLDRGGSTYGSAKREMDRSKSKELREVFEFGLGMHHAGLLRSDRNLVERLFAEGAIRVLCCTATLAWGVNLPANTVVIKGTQVYNAEKGGFMDLGILDVLQIFGRAGRPQFDVEGTGIIITGHERLAHYLALINRQIPIESTFIKALPDHLNAEIVLGTVTNVREAVAWLSYTYLHVRMVRNPLAYGVPTLERDADPSLASHRQALVLAAARRLDKLQMIRFDERSGGLFVTDLGRIASHFYLSNASVETYGTLLRQNMTDADVLSMISQSSEFQNINCREDEQKELERLLKEACPIPVKGSADSQFGKVNVLLQAYISRARIDGFALTSDTMFVVQSAPRIVRGLFEAVLKRGWTTLADKLLTFCKVIERRVWPFSHPLRQFAELHPGLTLEILGKLEAKKTSLDDMADMSDAELGALVNHPRAGAGIARAVKQFPYLSVEVHLQPVTRTVLRMQLTVYAEFEWAERLHGGAETFWVWVEDPDTERIYHSEYLTLGRRDREVKLAFTIPVFEPLPAQYYVRVVSDKWLGSETWVPVSFRHLVLPDRQAAHTPLLDLPPLAVSALHHEPLQRAFFSRFSHFNPVQTQIFHALFHTDVNVLLGAPTGSGKTVAAEFAAFRALLAGGKVVYIAPLKALVRERVADWAKKFGAVGKRVVELTGDTAPDVAAIHAADLILTTPEKWDGITRDWRRRPYVQRVRLVVIDEIHLLGADRGPVLEVIVSRMRYIAEETGAPIRVVGLSTALANAGDLADWLGIPAGPGPGLYNFHPSVRPVPLEVHIAGFEGKHYCPRMATMNKPCYAAIMLHSPDKPTLIFVASRRQTRLTALDLMSYCAADERPRQWCRLSEDEMEAALASARDPSLRHTLQFGIGLHHAGLHKADMALVEDLFLTGKILVVVATSTLAWGVNLPAHLVVVKGTEYFDGKTSRYVDYPITDVLQMMGRAGRPQFDTEAKAVILVHEPKKEFYKKFLYEPFPVESALPEVLADHLNAEVACGTITSTQGALDYLTWTFFYHRLLKNPSYYGLDDLANLPRFLSALVERVLADLAASRCVEVTSSGGGPAVVAPLVLGKIASYYYLSHRTVRWFWSQIKRDMDILAAVRALAGAAEFEELPVRHNEDVVNATLAKEAGVSEVVDYTSAHGKTLILLHAHFSRTPLPISDYATDLKSVLDQALRVLHAMVDTAAEKALAGAALQAMRLTQMVVQGAWAGAPSLRQLPHGELFEHPCAREGLPTLAHVASAGRERLERVVSRAAGQNQQRQAEAFLAAAAGLPLVDVAATKPSPNQVAVTLTRAATVRRPARVHTPHFPRPRDPGVWVLVVRTATDELLAVKRAAFQPDGPTTVKLECDGAGGFEPGHLRVIVASDSYIGLDQFVEL
jgi:activating signal cointegrator complex subunit 3